MRRIRRFVGLTRSRQLGVLRAIPALLRARLDLVVRPGKVVDIVARTAEDLRESKVDPEELPGDPPERGAEAVGQGVREVAWSVRTAADNLPGEWTCLVRALASYRLLERVGASPRLVLGARQPDSGTLLDAHAWVEVDDVPVLGDHPDLAEYAVLDQGGDEGVAGTGR